MIEKNIDIEQLQQILNREDNKDETCISIYEVAILMKEARCLYEKNKTDVEKSLRETRIKANPFYYINYVRNETSYNVNDINDNFLIDIVSLNYIKIRTKNMDLSVIIIPKHNPERVEKKYGWVCADTLRNFIIGKEEKIMQNIYIKIEDCPKFMQPILYKYRKQQLAKEKEIAIQKNNEDVMSQSKTRTRSFMKK